MYPYPNGPFGNMMPYSNFHGMNLDWTIQVVKDFLDQYTHIQEQIDAGVTQINEAAAEKLAELNQLGTELVNNLENTYNAYNDQLSQDCATLLVEFQTRAQEIVALVAETLPEDYTDLSTAVQAMSTDVAFINKQNDIMTDYDIYMPEWTNDGGISNGVPYDVAEGVPHKRFRTTTSFPFPKGSYILIPDNLLSDFSVWVHMYWDAGRWDGIFFGDSAKRLDSFAPDSFAAQTEDMYIAIAGRTLNEDDITSDMLDELKKTVRIAVPKQVESQTDDRLGGDVSGAKNLFNNIPFLFNRAAYPYKTWGNIMEEADDDTRTWVKSNADFSIQLPAGTYYLYPEFISNSGLNPSAIAYYVYHNNGTAIINRGSRTPEYFNNFIPFTLDAADTIHIQWKSYTGNKWKFYLVSDNYDTLKQLSNKVSSLEEYLGQSKYTEIYTNPVHELIRKYDAVADAGNVGYIWISDLHVNSLYPSRTDALVRQMMACADLATRTNIQFIVVGGDVLDREISYNTIYDLINTIFAGVKLSNRPVIFLLGNHDDNPYQNSVPLTHSQTKALYVDQSTIDLQQISFQDAYYYIDKKGIRFYCLDAINYPAGYTGSTWWGFSQDQVEWMASQLTSYNGKSVILSHITYDYTHNMYNLGNNGGYTKDLTDLLEAYNNRESITLYGNTYNYAAATGKVLFWHAGHQHFDEQYTPTDNTIPILVTSCAKPQTVHDGLVLVSGNTYTTKSDFPWNSLGWQCKFWPTRTIGTIKESTIDVVNIGSSQVDVFRLGAGEDRSFNI